jgi:hypothetical protein
LGTDSTIAAAATLSAGAIAAATRRTNGAIATPAALCPGPISAAAGSANGSIATAAALSAGAIAATALGGLAGLGLLSAASLALLGEGRGYGRQRGSAGGEQPLGHGKAPFGRSNGRKTCPFRRLAGVHLG